MITRSIATILFLAICFGAVPMALAVDVAPRISDREIIEGLTVLKQGNQAINTRLDDLNKRFDDMNKRFDDMNKRFDNMNQNVNQRFADINKRFDDMNKRFDNMNQNVNQRFTDINKRFDNMSQTVNQRFTDMNQRFDNMSQTVNQRFADLQNLIVALFGSVMALIIMLIGYMIWDRKTAQQPMKTRLAAIEEQLDPDNTDHSILARLLAAQRKIARTNPEVAEALRSYTLL